MFGGCFRLCSDLVVGFPAETSPVSFQTGLDSPIEKRVETVGRVIPHVDGKIINPATGETVPLGVPGELLSRGYIVMDGGYWGEPEKTREAVDADGFMHTGNHPRLLPNCYCSDFEHLQAMWQSWMKRATSGSRAGSSG